VAVGSIVIFGAESLLDDLSFFVLVLSSLLVSCSTTKTIASGIRSSTRLRMVRLRLWRFSASCMAARRASLFWR